MPETKPKILVIDDDRTMGSVLRHSLEMAGFHVRTAESAIEALGLEAPDIDIVILDLDMPGMHGLDAIPELKRLHASAEILVLTGSEVIQDAVEAMRRGAYDYLNKPIHPGEVIEHVRRAVAHVRLSSENRNLKGSLRSVSPSQRLLGESEAVRNLERVLDKFAPLPATILLTGESGAGKNHVARLIHMRSPRRDGPYVPINCTVLPRELIESELYGHERGAFTGATDRRIGKAELANGGTLFLDEIGDMPLDLQPKLLTFLQDHAFQRLGGNQQIAVDVRIIAATNHDLPEMVRQRAFREDLYFRLNVLPIEIPGLRDRRSDIPILAGHILKRIAGQRGTEPTLLAEGALRALNRYDWPGNVRELENVLERASAVCDKGSIDIGDLPDYIRGGEEEVRPAPRESLVGYRLQDLERMAVEQTLAACNGNRSMAARQLGISEKTIYNKLKRG